jgi:hypothetical protein
VIYRLQMARTLTTPDERLNELVDEIARLTGENYVVAMCRALEERRERLVAAKADADPDPVLRVTLEIREPGRSCVIR